MYPMEYPMGHPIRSYRTSEALIEHGYYPWSAYLYPMGLHATPHGKPHKCAHPMVVPMVRPMIANK